jgi:hypothetical protein
VANDSDPDNDSLSATLLVGPTHASSFTLNSNGTFTYVHNGNTASSDTFTYQLSDGHGGTATATATLMLTPRPPSPWQNRANNMDVNNDTFVTPQDALILINGLNLTGPVELPPPSPGSSPPPFIDVNGDGQLTPQDVLQVVNELNRVTGGEGESFASNSSSSSGAGEELFGSLLVLPGGVSSQTDAEEPTRPLWNDLAIEEGSYEPTDDLAHMLTAPRAAVDR